ncbi:MAG TPA: amidohydrolase family protein, partial [Xanthobacteraceae bacterium]|nr:amidohydrolase family protein [Xanthobacteraceae bacterium]
QKRYPARFTGLLWVDEAIADRPEVLAEVDRAHNALGLKGVYYSHDFSRHGYDRNLDHAAFAPFWDKLAGFGLPAFVELSATPGYDRASYIANLLALDRVMQRHRALRFVLVMGPPVAHFARAGRWDFPPEALAAYGRENLLIEIMFPIAWGGVWDYPYPQAQALIRHMRELFGASKLVWGSDMPNVERFCTYRQSLDYLRRYCTFFLPAEMDAVVGGTMAELFRLKERCRA